MQGQGTDGAAPGESCVHCESTRLALHSVVKAWAVVALFIVAATAACGLADPPGLPTMQPTSEGGGSGSGGADDMNTTSLLASISGGAYQTSSTFTQLTLAPYPSVAAPGSTVR